MSNSLGHILKELEWSGGLIRDLLIALPEDKLSDRPIPSAGTWAQQFRHIARVKENYSAALKRGKVEFGVDGCSFSGSMSRSALLEYAAEMDKFLSHCIKDAKPAIDWFGESWSIERHLQALVSHDVLHHGQLILYARAAKLKLPKSWEVWGET